MCSNDEELVAAYACDQDAEAFAALVERYRSFVYATCMRRLKNSADAEDAAQEVFLSLSQNAQRLKGTNLGGWLYRTAINTANSRLRSDITRVKREQSQAVANYESDSSAEWRQIEELLDMCMAELPAESREILIQRFFLNRSQDELAKSFDVDQATVSRWIKKSIELLRRQFKSRGISLSAATIAAALTADASAVVPANVAGGVSRIGTAGVESKTKLATLTSLVIGSWLTLGAALVATAIAAAAVLSFVYFGAISPDSEGIRSASQLRSDELVELSLDDQAGDTSSDIALSGQGNVVMYVESPPDLAGVYLLGKGRPRRLRAVPEHQQRTLAINENNTVVIGYDRRVEVINANTSRLLTEANAVGSPPSINARGQVAYIESDPTNRIRLADRDGVRTLYQSGDEFTKLFEVCINDSGDVAFRAETARGNEAICLAIDGTPILVAEVGERFSAIRPCLDFNDQGQVAFLAQLTDGSEAILLGGTEGLKQIACTDKYFTRFQRLSLSNRGLVAFTAQTAQPPSKKLFGGLYLWNGSFIWELSKPGELSRNRTMEGVALWRDCLNEAGQIAVLADYGSHRAAILRVETQHLESAD